MSFLSKYPCIISSEYSLKNNQEIESQFLNFIYVSWEKNDDSMGYILQSSYALGEEWVDISMDDVDFDGVDYFYWAYAISDNQFFRLIKRE